MNVRTGKRVVVTRGDIAAGQRSASCFSPITHALRRAGFRRAILHGGAFTYGVRVRKMQVLPEVALTWLRDYNAGSVMPPFQFTVGGR